MRILFHIGHPAHFNLYKNIIQKLIDNSHQVLITYIKKDIVEELVSEIPVPNICLGPHHKRMISKIISVPLLEYKLYKICNQFMPDICIESGSFYSMHVSKILNFKSYYFCDTETASLINPMSRFFSQKIFTPKIYKKNLGKNHIRYNGMQELAYLHPNYFTPSPEILSNLKVDKSEKFITLRLVSWDATHDNSLHSPVDQIRYEKIKELSQNYKIFISSETPLPNDLEKYRVSLDSESMHNLLFYSSLFIGEGVTMCAESAFLGTPSILIYPNRNLGSVEFLKFKGTMKNVSYWEDFNLELIENLEINDINKWEKIHKDLLEGLDDVSEYIYKEIILSNEN